MIPGVTARPRVDPPSTPVPVVTAAVAPAAMKSFNHVAGEVVGRNYQLQDVNAMAWWDGASLDEPVRVELAESANQLFTDAKIQLTYYPSLPLNPGSYYLINTAFKERPEYKFTPLKLDRELNGLHSIAGETIMGRLARSYPKSNILEVGPMTARAALKKLIAAWRNEGFNWLELGAFPALYIKGGSGKYYEPTLNALTVVYDEDNPRSMQDILAEFTDSFPGYILRADRSNRLQLVPPPWVPLYIVEVAGGNPTWRELIDNERGVDVEGKVTDGAAETPFNIHLGPGEDVSITAGTTTLTLEYTDGLQLRAPIAGPGQATFNVKRPLAYLAAEDEEDRSESTDTSRIVNRATVRVDQSYEYVADQNIVEPAFFKVYGFGPYCFPVLDEFLRPTNGDLGDPTEHDLGEWHAKDYRDPQAACPFDVTSLVPVGLVPPVPGTIIGGDKIKVNVTVEWWGDQCGDLSGPGHIGTTELTDVDVALNTNGPSLLGIHAPVTGIYGGSCYEGLLWLGLLPLIRAGVFRGIYVYWAGRLFDKRMGFQPPLGDGNNILGVGVFISAVGERWQIGEDTTIGQWGYNVEHDEKQTPGLANSQATYGVRERTHNIRAYKLKPEVVQDIARAMCERPLNPIKVYQIAQYPPYKFGPSDLLNMVALFTGEVGYVTEWRYSEAHTPGRAITGSSVTVEVFDNIEAENIELTAWDALAWDYGRWME